MDTTNADMSTIQSYIKTLETYVKTLETKMQKIEEEVKLLQKQGITIMNKKILHNTTSIELELDKIYADDNDGFKAYPTETEIYDLNMGQFMHQIEFLPYVEDITLSIDDTFEAIQMSHNICKDIKHKNINTVIVNGYTSYDTVCCYNYFGGVLHYIPNMIHNMPKFAVLEINNMRIQGYLLNPRYNHRGHRFDYIYPTSADDKDVIHLVTQLEKAERTLKRITFTNCCIEPTERNTIEEYCKNNKIEVKFMNCTNIF